MENEYSKTERIEDAQLDSALAFRSWKEKHDKKKEAMLEAFRDIHGQYGVDELAMLRAEKDAEIRRLQRALFIAHAIKAKFKWWWMSECKHNESCKLFPDPRKIKKFTNSAWACSKSQDKCRAKAEEYK